MTREKFRKFMVQVFNTDIQNLYLEGNKEYGSDSNAFENFEGLSAETGLPRCTVLWILFLKHKDGVSAWLNGHRSQRESVKGRIYDMIVYLFLLLGMLEEVEHEIRSIMADSGGKQRSESYSLSGGKPGDGLGSVALPPKDRRLRDTDVQTEPT